MRLETNTGEMKPEFTAFAFTYCQPSCLSKLWQPQLSYLLSQRLSQTLYVKGTAECGRECRGEQGSLHPRGTRNVHPQGQSASSGVTQEEW